MNASAAPQPLTTNGTSSKLAKEKASVGKPIYIYDDNSELVVRYGSWH
jgi:hypothetical protein